MDGRKDTLTDAALDHQIETMLAVDPSPEFVARIRARVADEAVSIGWRWRWPATATVAMTAVIVAAIVTWRPTDSVPSSAIVQVKDTSVTRPPVSQTATASTPAPADRGVRRDPRVVTQRPTTRVARHDAARAATRDTAPSPEVLIPENEKRGFEMLLEELSDQRSAAVIAEVASGRTTPGPPWLDIAPVTIEPLQDVSAHQGEAQ